MVRKSGESAKLNQFAESAVEEFRKQCCGAYKRVDSSTLFSDVAFDAVLASGSDVILVEVALGGRGGSLKPGPERKMVADAFKLSSARTFLKTPVTISRRVILVRSEWIVRELTAGWRGKALSAQGVEVLASHLNPGQLLEAEEILDSCAIDEDEN